MFISPSGKRYIGQAVNFRDRYITHKCASTNRTIRQDKDTPFHRAIKKYGIENFEIVILKENLKTQCLMNLWEMYYIERYNTLSKFNEGYNLSDGGQYANPYAGKTSEEIKEIGQKRSKTLKEKYKNGEIVSAMKGKKHTEEARIKMKEKQKEIRSREDYTNPLKDRIVTEETKKKLKEKRKDRIGSNSPCHKQVMQFTKDGEYLKTWEYVKQASEELGIHKDCISRCARGKVKTAGGFIWKYKK